MASTVRNTLKQVRYGIFTIRWWTFPCGLFYLGWMEYMCRYCIKSGFQSSLSWCPSRSCIHGWWYSATISLWSLCIYYMPLRYYSLSPNKRFSFKLQKGGSWSMLTWQNDTKWFICIPNPCRWMGTQINNNFWEQKKFRLLQKYKLITMVNSVREHPLDLIMV